jgi:DNA-binding Xre family transcriptional regulator
METKIKKILEKKNMTQTDLFNSIKSNCNNYLGKDVISKIVNGKKENYEIFTLLKICLALNVSPNDIIEKNEFVKTQVNK